jgi:hypothetical protein
MNALRLRLWVLKDKLTPRKRPKFIKRRDWYGDMLRERVIPRVVCFFTGGHQGIEKFSGAIICRNCPKDMGRRR